MVLPYMVGQCDLVGAHQPALFARLRAAGVDLFMVIEAALRFQPLAAVFALLGSGQFDVVVIVHFHMLQQYMLHIERFAAYVARHSGRLVAMHIVFVASQLTHQRKPSFQKHKNGALLKELLQRTESSISLSDSNDSSYRLEQTSHSNCSSLS